MDTTEQLLTDEAVIAELTREAGRRGYLVIALSKEDKAQLLMYLCGIVVGFWLAGVGRG